MRAVGHQGRVLQPRHIHNGGVEPLTSRRRPMSDLLASSGDALGRVPSGYGERHVRTVSFGTGEARLASLVSKDRSYKPVVKANGGKRESDGVVVPMIAGRNPAGGKDPDFGHASRAGKREGMPGTAPDNYPRSQKHVLALLTLV